MVDFYGSNVGNYTVHPMDPEVAIEIFVVTQPGGGKTSSSPLLSPSSSVDFVEVKLPGWNVYRMAGTIWWTCGLHKIEGSNSSNLLIHTVSYYIMYIYSGIVNILNISVELESFRDL